MFKLNDIVHKLRDTELGNDDFVELYCRELSLKEMFFPDKEGMFFTNELQNTLDVYCYTLVERGRLDILYNGQLLTLEPGDLYLYSPGFRMAVVGASDDYSGIALFADRVMTLEMPAVRDLVHIFYFPIAEYGQPVVHIQDSHLHRLTDYMRKVIEYQYAPHRFRTEVLRHLYTLFLLDLYDMQESVAGSNKHIGRSSELFFGFMRLLPTHFVEHQDIGFYASELCVTTTHLSRVVRQVSGRTVMDYIDQMLLMEALWLLQSTDLSLAAISDRLHFANQASFSRFFTRMKGQPPMTYRSKKQ